jgi:hypothetical protein
MDNTGACPLRHENRTPDRSIAGEVFCFSGIFI